MKSIAEENLMHVIEDLYRQDPDDFILIEVGANDGYCCDRMHPFVLKNDPHSIMVEPLPDYFAKLKKNYSHLKNINYENIALSNTDGVNKMTYIPEEEIANENVRFRMDTTPHLWKEHWAGGLGSFYDDKNCLGCPELKRFQKTINVPTKTFRYLIDKYDISSYKNIVLQTDCEGHDLILMKSFPFDVLRPKIYICEIYGKTRYPPSHPNFGTNKGLYSQQDEEDASQILKNNNYRLYRSNDMIGILEG